MQPNTVSVRPGFIAYDSTIRPDWPSIPRRKGLIAARPDSVTTFLKRVTDGQRRTTVARDPSRGRLSQAPLHIVDGRYQLLSVLGEGGMGTVYHAFDTHTDQHCALKSLSAEQSAGSHLLRLEREFQTAARLQHPNCVRVFDYGESDEGPFFTMEWVAGGSLEETGPWSTVDVVQIALQLLAALDHVHSRHIVHRDIKPENILLCSRQSRSPQVKLCDFGVARTCGALDVVRVGAIVGSVQYLSPEQARGETADLRSDLYALGVVLYELLAGRLPLKSEQESVKGWCQAHQEQPPLPLEQVAPRVPRPVVRAVMRLLEKDPELRYPTAASAYQDLASWIHGGSAVTQGPPLLCTRTLSQPRFVGHRRELQRAQAFVRRALSNDRNAPAILSIMGAAGSGKSSLINQLLPLANTLQARLYVQSCRRQPSRPYEPLLGLLGDDSQNAQLQAGKQTLTILGQGEAQACQRWKLETEEHWPARLRRVGNPVSPLPDNEALFRCIVDQLFDIASRHPCLLVIEDLQWADDSTVELLRFCIDEIVRARIGTTPPPQIAVILTHREPLSAPYRLADAHHLRLGIGLGPIDSEAATQLVASVLPEASDEEARHITERLIGDEPVSPLQLNQRLWELFRAGTLRWTAERWRLE